MKRILSSPVALALALLSFLLLGLALSSWITCAWFLLGVIICALPGWFACRLLYGGEYARRAASLGHTLILGLLLTTFLSVCIAALGLGLTVPTMLAAASVVALALFLLGLWFKEPVVAHQDDDPAVTRLAITVGLILVLVVVSGPLFSVGRPMGDSYVYAPYFNRDFLRNVAFGASLSQGEIPPANPYFKGETLHYYWFQMVFPAQVYRLSGRSVVLEDIFLLSTLLVDIAFVFVFVHFLRRFVRRVPALVLVVGLAFAAESYQALFKAVLALQPTHWALEGTWLGAIALPPVGYFFQSLLYLPHHLSALVTFVIVISLMVEHGGRGRVKRALSAGTLLILASGFSFFIIAFGFLWAGSYLAWQALKDVVKPAKLRGSAQRRSSFAATVLSGLLVGGAGLVAYALLDRLDMLLGGGNAWSIAVNKFHLVAPLHFLVMLGPMLVLGLAGFVISARSPKMRSRWDGLLWLFLSVLLLITFVVPKNLPAWEVSQKLGVVLRVAALVLAGVFLDRLVDEGIRERKVAWVALLLFCASALPNLLAYEYVHLNVGDSNLLTYVGRPERDAAEWIRAQTPLDAVVQTWPGGQTSVRPYYQSDGGVYSLVPVFGERQTVVGDPQFTRYYLPGLMYGEVDVRATRVSQIYERPDQVDVVNVLEQFHIDYVYWGIAERECCLEKLGWYEESSQFEKVYDRDGVSIFRFTHE